MVYYRILNIAPCPIYVSEKAMAPHSSTLAWKIPWTEEPGELQSLGSQRVRYDLATKQQQYILVFYSFLLPNKMKVKVKSLSHV